MMDLMIDVDDEHLGAALLSQVDAATREVALERYHQQQPECSFETWLAARWRRAHRTEKASA